MKNKNIAKVASDILLLLADYTDCLIEFYPNLSGLFFVFVIKIKCISNTSLTQKIFQKKLCSPYAFVFLKFHHR